MEETTTVAIPSSRSHHQEQEDSIPLTRRIDGEETLLPSMVLDSNSKPSKAAFISLPTELRLKILNEAVTIREIVPGTLFKVQLCDPQRDLPMGLPSTGFTANRVCRTLNEDMNYLIYGRHHISLTIRSPYPHIPRSFAFPPHLVAARFGVYSLDVTACHTEIELMEAIYAGLHKSTKLRTFLFEIDHPQDVTLRRRWAAATVLQYRNHQSAMALLPRCKRELVKLRWTIDLLKSGD